ncbi:MAG: PQQ-binding-like beta-propeller repeat protein [Casimicrobiaceae bacterium]
MDITRRHMLRAGVGAFGLAALTPQLRAQDAAEVDGIWTGALQLPQGDGAALALRIARAKDGQHVVRLTMPAMHVFDAAIEALERLGASRFRLDPFGTVATLHGDRLSGEFAYLRVPFALDRVAALPDWKETAEPSLPDAPAPRWTRSLRAPAWAAPVVRDGLAYLGDTGGTVHALRALDGTTAWTHRHGTPIYGDAAVDADGVSFVDERSMLTRLDRHTGRLLWQVALDPAAAGKAPDDFTFTHRTPRPAIAGRVLYVGGRDRSVRAIDLATGRVLWRCALDGTVMSGIAVTARHLVAGTFERNAIVAIDRRNGRLAWAFPTAQPVSSMPVVANDVVLAGCRDFGIHGLALDTGAPRWVHSYLFSWVESSPAVVGGVAYFGSSDLRSVRAISIASGRTLFTTDVRGLTWGTPALAGDRIYAGTAGQKDVLVAHRPGVCALDRRTGALLWRRELPMGDARMAGFASSLAVAGGMLVGATVDGTVLGIPHDA